MHRVQKTVEVSKALSHVVIASSNVASQQRHIKNDTLMQQPPSSERRAFSVDESKRILIKIAFGPG